MPIGTLSPWEENELKYGRAGVYAWGIVAYNDLYGDRHETQIRFVCEGDGIINGEMHACEEGNSST
ncbi:MAG: hypothetical protein ACREDH_00185 [Methylocella sp.]